LSIRGEQLLAAACGAVFSTLVLAYLTKKYLFEAHPLPVKLLELVKTYRHWFDLGGVEYDDD
jgi:hypothetical protein